MTGADGDSLSDRAVKWFEQMREADAKRGPKPRIFAVMGLGTFGGTIARELMRFGNDVIGIDRNEKVVADFADDLTQAIVLDARDEAALKEAGLSDCDVAIVATASDLEASVLAAVNLRFVGIDMIWAKAESRTHHRILSKLGVDRVINPEEESGRTVAQMLHNPLIRDYATLGNGYHVVNFIVPDVLEGRDVGKLEALAKHDVRVLGVMRGSEFLGAADCPKPLETDDKLILLGTRAKLRDFAESL